MTVHEFQKVVMHHVSYRADCASVMDPAKA